MQLNFLWENIKLHIKLNQTDQLILSAKEKQLMSLIEQVTPVNKKDLFQTRNQKDDERIGDIIDTEMKSYSEANVVIVGCPQDEGVKRNLGRPGAKDAPKEIRRAFYNFALTPALQKTPLCDLGDTKIGSTLEDTHETHFNMISQILNDGKTIIVLGGGNDLAYPDCKALNEMDKNTLAINIDKHYDARPTTPRNSGTPYRQLLDEKILTPHKFFEVGIQPFLNSEKHTNFLSALGVNIFELNQVRKLGIQNLFQEIFSQAKSEGSIFLGLDMDSIQPSEAPGVSAVTPFGFRGDEILEVALLAGQNPKVKIFEITEVNPKYDIDSRTAKLAATFMIHFVNERFQN